MLLTTAEGVIAGVTPTAARIDERDSVFDLPLERIRGALLGDQGFIRPVLTEDLSGMGIALPTPLRDHMRDSRPKSFVAQIVSVRRRIETVIGQRAERFSVERHGARKLWPLVSRIYRKVAAHTLGVLIRTSRCAKTLAVGFSHLQEGGRAYPGRPDQQVLGPATARV